MSQVLDLTEGDLEPKPSFGARIRLDYLAGMAKQEGRLVLLLDVDKVLSVAELELADAVSGEQASQVVESDR